MKNVFTTKNFLFILLTLVGAFLYPSIKVHAEGSKQLTRFGVESRILFGLRNFARFNSLDTNARLCFTIKSTQERVYFGFGLARNQDQFNGSTNFSTFFRVKDSFGNIVRNTQRLPRTSAEPGFIQNSTQSSPSIIQVGGYDPGISFIPPSPGTYYIELTADTTRPQGTFNLEHFDVTVINSNTNQEQIGRLWSRQWSITAGGFNRPTRAEMFIYSADSVVTKIDFNGMEPFNFFIGANSKGVNFTSNPLINRKSRQGEAINPDYLVFLQNPDSTIWPNGTDFIRFLEQPVLAFCPNRGYRLKISVNKGQEADIYLEFNGIAGYQEGTSDRKLTVSLQAGVNLIPFDGRDGLGNLLTNAMLVNVPIELVAYRGVTHLPLFDVENNANGFIISLVRPLTGNLRVFWDDTNLPDGLANLSGCIGSCHSFPSPLFGNDNTINTWWNTGTYLPLTSTLILDTLCPTISLSANVVRGSYCSDLGYAIPIYSGYSGRVKITWIEQETGIEYPGFGRDERLIFSYFTPYLLIAKDLYTEYSDTVIVSPLPQPDSIVFYNAEVVEAPFCSYGVADVRIFGLSSVQYRWRDLSSGRILPAPDTFQQLSAYPGRYRLIATSLEFGCKDSLDFEILGSGSAVDVSLNRLVQPRFCSDSGMVKCSVNFPVEQAGFRWKNLETGAILSTTSDSLKALPGRYRVIAFKLSEGINICSDSLDVEIIKSDSIKTLANIVQPNTCGSLGRAYIQLVDSVGNYSFTWKRRADQVVVNNCCNRVELPEGEYVALIRNETFGCSDSTLIKIISPGNPNIELDSIVQPTCTNPKGLLKVKVSTGSTSLIYRWRRLPDGLVLPDTAQNRIKLNPGVYRLVVKDLGGICSDSIDLTLNEPVIPNIDFSGLPDSTCISSGSFNLSSEFAGGRFSGTGISGNVFTPTKDGVFEITYSLNLGSCRVSRIRTIKVNSIPNSNFSIPDKVCLNSEPVSLVPDQIGGLFEGGNVVSASYFPNSIGTDSVKYSISINGCSSTLTKKINVIPNPSLETSNTELEIEKGNSVNLNVQSDGKVKWTPSTGLSTDTGLNVIAFPLSDTTYTIIATNDLGCFKTLTIKIRVNTNIKIPNVFTPNGDLVNEYFAIKNLPDNSNLSIYNRYGSLVYEKNGYSNDWSANNLPEGMYYYLLSTSGNQTFKGWVQVMK